MSESPEQHEPNRQLPDVIRFLGTPISIIFDQGFVPSLSPTDCEDISFDYLRDLSDTDKFTVLGMSMEDFKKHGGEFSPPSQKIDHGKV